MRLAEDGQRGRAGGGELARQGRRVEVGADEPFGRRGLLQLGDYAGACPREGGGEVRRRRQRGGPFAQFRERLAELAQRGVIPPQLAQFFKYVWLHLIVSF